MNINSAFKEKILKVFGEIKIEFHLQNSTNFLVAHSIKSLHEKLSKKIINEAKLSSREKLAQEAPQKGKRVFLSQIQH